VHIDRAKIIDEFNEIEIEEPARARIFIPDKLTPIPGKLTPYEDDTPKGTWLTENNERLN